MSEIISYDKNNLPSADERKKILDFLYKNLQEYGDPLKDIEKAISYSLAEDGKPGGFIAVLFDQPGEIACSVVVNRTGMSGYIPENILVYIATHHQKRGRGFGREAVEYTISRSEGDIALHVESDNPAQFLYRKLGFENKYLEMRLKK